MNLLFFILLTFPALRDSLFEKASQSEAFSKLLEGTTFFSYTFESQTDSPSGDDLIRLSFWNEGEPGAQGDERYVHLLRTYSLPKSKVTSLDLYNSFLPLKARIRIYRVNGSYMDRGIMGTDVPPRNRYIQFAPKELRHDEVLLLQELPLPPGAGQSIYSQAIQLERGWNLVSWYLVPPDPTPLDLVLYMDDLFDVDALPWGPQNWFISEYSTDPPDKVGRYNETPQEPDPHFYPEFGKNNNPPAWTWNLRYAYPIYMDSPAHFWEFTDRPLYEGETPPQDDFIPEEEWDDYHQAGIPTTDEAYWFFISYPQRMQLRLSQSSTIDWLAHYTSNRLKYIKDDDGHFYDPEDPNHSNLEYLKPGKGYFLGYLNNNEVVDCPWFFDEVGVPAGIPESPKGIGNDQSEICSAAHFQFKSRTHWWYPITIDTVAADSLIPAAGDEMGVFCGDLCVGATVFAGEYPIYLPAWMDDVATPDSLDGYLVAQEMTFKWFDVSANQEITFVPPPGTQAMEADPYFPTHSGFGKGFAARRTLTWGVQSVQQFPQEYRVLQNYPNPFNAETVIPLELPQRSHVRIELFNLQGRRLGTIYEGIQNAGMVKIKYNAKSLSSGVYFYRVIAEGLERGGKFADTGKMLVLK